MDKIKKLIKEALLNHKHDCGCGCHGKCAKAPMLNENLGAKVIMTENMQYHIDNKKALTENTFRYGSKAFLDLWAEARYLYSRDAINLSGEDKIIVETTHLGEYGLFEGEMVPLDLPIMEEVDEAISGADTDEIFALISKVKQQGRLSDDAQHMLMQWMSHPDASKEAIVKVLKQLTGTLDEAEYSFSVGDKVGMKHAENDDEYRNKYEVMSIGSDGMVDLRNVETGQPAKMQASKLSKNIDEAKDGKHVLNKPKRGGSKKFYVYVRNPKTKKIKKVSFGDTSGLSAKINNPEARRAFSKRHDCPNKTDKTKASYWSCRLPRYAKALGLKSNFTGFW
jgi:hypothetical protein